ncbi:MAG: TRAP transporter substrate-binding protein [Thermodesulfobacteriota bacterium]
MKKYIQVLLIVSVGLFFLMGITGPFAQPVDLKITTVQLKQQQMGVGIDRFAKYAQEKLGDKVRIRTYPAAQLYTGQEEIQALIKGEIQMAYLIGSALELVDETQELLKLPFFYPSIDVCYAFLDGPMGKKLFTKLEEKGILILSTVSSGNVAISNNKRTIRRPDDFKGLKMRSFGRMGAATLKSLGALAIVTASEETYTALQQGVIDGMTTPVSAFLARKYYDIQKFVTDGGMLNATLAVMATNKAWWNNLSPDVRTGLTESLQRLIKEQRAEMEVENKKIFEQIAVKGCQVHFLSPDEQSVLKKALQPVYEEFTPKIGTNLVKESQQEVERLAKGKK